MRITTQMMNESARKAGLPVNNTSLLNYINSDENNSSLLQALNKNKNTSTAAVDTVSKKNYEALGKEADKLTDATAVFLQENDDNLFTQAKESGDNQKIYDSIESLFENYNSTLKALKNTSGTLNDFYRQMLAETPEEAKDSLESIGITFAKDGTASVDMDKVKEADLETLENLFGSKSDFVSKMNYISTRISNNAQANVESLSSAYSSNGSLYSGSSSSKYDFFG